MKFVFILALFWVNLVELVRFAIVLVIIPCICGSIMAKNWNLWFWCYVKWNMTKHEGFVDILDVLNVIYILNIKLEIRLYCHKNCVHWYQSSRDERLACFPVIFNYLLYCFIWLWFNYLFVLNLFDCDMLHLTFVIVPSCSLLVHLYFYTETAVFVIICMMLQRG